jgi:transketolase
MTGFGASAPAKALYEHFAITAEAVSKAALSLVCRVGVADSVAARILEKQN